MSLKPQTFRPVKSHKSRISLIAALGLTLGGCASLQPEILQKAEIIETVQSDKIVLKQDVPPLVGALSLEEAIARALKYNAEKRLKAMEEAVASGVHETSSFEMLPKLVASAGYRDRNNDLISRSRDSVTGAPSLANPSISTERHAATNDLTFSWSLLDFGQSYYAAKQNADRLLVAQERRRKALHTLIQDVRTAYWRMVAAQALRSRIQTTMQEAETGLADARKAEEERLRNPLDPLRFQLQILENLKLLETIEQELSTARIELASLTNIPFAHEIKVIEPGTPISRAWIDASAERLEEHALLNNAELRESLYNTRIARQETRRALLRLFPGLSFNYASKHSDDSYLINQSWNESGAQLSLNLLGLLAAPAQMRLADAGIAAADQKRLVTQMAVLTQLHIARLQYANALRQFDRADTIVKVESRIAEHVVNQEKAEKQTRLDRVARQTALILSELRRYQALSNAHTAASRLQATLGMEPTIASENSISLQELTDAVSNAIQKWNKGQSALEGNKPLEGSPMPSGAAPKMSEGTPLNAKPTT